MFIQITQISAHYFKLFNRVQSTQDEKARFIKGNELKLTQVELFSFLFLREYLRDIPDVLHKGWFREEVLSTLSA